MSTATLMLVVGCVVVLKSSLFVAFVVRRDRRQRRRLEAATAAPAAPARRADPDPSGWHLQWAEPGVLLVQNADAGDGAREVELTATLTAPDAQTASVRRTERFVGTGACFEVRFAALEAGLGALVADAGSSGTGRAEARHRLACTLAYTLDWRTPDDEPRRESRTAVPVVPVPDLALDAA